jgi:hypothetical protein
VDAPGHFVGRPSGERFPVDVIMDINIQTAQRMEDSGSVALIATPTSMVTYDDAGRPELRGVSIRTEPPLDQDAIWPLLGVSPVGAEDMGLQAQVQEQAFGILASELRLRLLEPAAESLRRAVGLDELTVNFTYDQPVELTVGKYLIPNLLVTYRRPFGGREEEYDLRLSYRASGKSYVTIATDETEQISVQFQWTQPVDDWGDLLKFRNFTW